MPKTGTIERREAHEWRTAGRALEGYAALFGTEARISGTIETIAAGAFTKSLSGDILALVDHDPARLLGRTKTGTLELRQDAKGLAFRIDLPDTANARDVLALAERGDLGGMSFGFRVPPGGESWTGNRRELRQINLMEISVVSAWPAYDGTSVTARSATPRLNALARFLVTVR